jgi:hypothetical protein
MKIAALRTVDPRQIAQRYVFDVHRVKPIAVNACLVVQGETSKCRFDFEGLVQRAQIANAFRKVTPCKGSEIFAGVRQT